MTTRILLCNKEAVAAYCTANSKGVHKIHDISECESHKIFVTVSWATVPTKETDSNDGHFHGPLKYMIVL